MDHDQHFKTIIQMFFPEFMELFFHVWLERIDVHDVRWLEQEVFSDPPTGARHAMDLVGEVKLKKPIPNWTGPRTKKSLILVHIEVESTDSITDIQARMPNYYFLLHQKHQLPILPIVIFLRVALDGIGTLESTTSLFDFEILKFRCHYIGLPKLDAVEYLQSDNPLGVALAALMKIPKAKIVELGAQALLKITQAKTTEQGKHLLARIVENYLPLGAKEQLEMAKLLEREEFREVKQMNLSSYDKGEIAGFEKGKKTGFKEGRQEGRQEGRNEGIQEGMQTGRREGLIERIESLMRVRFRKVNARIMSQVRAITDLERLKLLGDQLEEIDSLKAFQELLKD